MTELPLWRRPAVRIAAIVLAIPALGLAWWLGSPLFLDDTVDEAFPLSAAAEVPDDMTQEQVEKEMDEAAAVEVTAEDPMPSEPTLLASANFAGADEFHQGSGTASVYELGDGSQVLRFEDFTVTNGPALRVIVTPSVSEISRNQLETDGYEYLGELKGNNGNQNYDVPEDLDLSSGEYTVVIYCEPFHVVFATAALTP